MSGYAPKTEYTSIQKLCIVVWHLNKLHKNGYIKDKCVEKEMKYVQLFIIVVKIFLKIMLCICKMFANFLKNIANKCKQKLKE